MITQSHIDQLVTLAGPKFEWVGTGSSKPQSTIANPYRVGLFDWLREYANGVCSFCGMKESAYEICHIVSAGPKRMGYLPGNLAYGCIDCNRDDRQRDARVVALSEIVRPDLIPTEWPDKDSLRMRGWHVMALQDDRRRERHRARGI